MHPAFATRALRVWLTIAAVLFASPALLAQPAPPPPAAVQKAPEYPATPEGDFAKCLDTRVKAWAIATQHFTMDEWQNKRTESADICNQEQHTQFPTASLCEGPGYSTPAMLLASHGIAQMPPMCDTFAPDTGKIVAWTHIDQSIWDKHRPSDGFIPQGGRIQVYRATPYPQTEPRKQGDKPDSLFALLYTNEGQQSLFPLNYSAENQRAIELPWAPTQLALAFDKADGVYLLYPAVALFKTPSWDASIVSWEDFAVWWFDPKLKSIRRVSLPSSPWLSDAKLDVVLARDARNFSCGTDCYRSYDIDVDSGNIFVTISGRESAVSKKVLGTYKLGPHDASWTKTKDGRPL